MNQLDFRNRRAVVTGGAAGIGFAVADRLAKSGAKVALWDRDERALANAGEKLDVAVMTHALDVTDHHAVERAAQATAERLGGIDVLVCSAGITGPNATTWDYPVDAWRQVFDVNVHGLFYCNRAVVPHHAQVATMGASSTSHRSPARKAIRTRRPTARRRPP